MMDKKAVEEALKKFDKKAMLHEINSDGIKVKISGLKEPEKFFSELLVHISAELKVQLDLKEIKKSARSHIAHYTKKPMSPSEEIISVLDRYYEGTKRDFDWEDD
ncbi:MAG TPA: hypothetical protein VI968_03870 [archaeon]|nr:hypothetical protein [archaeon]